jgi:hypothetical protein
VSAPIPVSPLRAYRLSMTRDGALAHMGTHDGIEAEVIPGVHPPAFSGAAIVMWRTSEGFRVAHRTSEQVARRTGPPVYVEGSFLPDPTGGRATETQLVVRAGRSRVPARRWWNRAAALIVGSGLSAVGLALTSGSLRFLLDAAAPLFFVAAVVWAVPTWWVERRNRAQRRALLTAVERALSPIRASDERPLYRT